MSYINNYLLNKMFLDKQRLKTNIGANDNRVICYFDGYADSSQRGDCCGCAICFSSEGVNLKHLYLEQGTCNEGEWIGLLLVLTMCSKFENKNIIIIGDSQLVINCATDKWKTKKPHLKKYKRSSSIKLNKIMIKNKISIEWSPRDYNTLADEFTNFIKNKYRQVSPNRITDYSHCYSRSY